MTVTTLREIEDSLRQLDPDTLREMVYRIADNHITVCDLTSRVGGCAHVGHEETRDRIEGLSVERLAAILAPTAWMSVDLHRRLGG